MAHSIFCFLLKNTNVYLGICMHISPLYVCRNYECKSVRCLISLLGDVALLGVLWQELELYPAFLSYCPRSPPFSPFLSRDSGVRGVI